jgi:hypothetical protein
MIGGTVIWYPVNEKMPELNDKNWFRHPCIVATSDGKVMAMDWTKNTFARSKKGQEPRWEWLGKISVWEIVAWAEMPIHPFPEMKGYKP